MVTMVQVLWILGLAILYTVIAHLLVYSIYFLFFLLLMGMMKLIRKRKGE